MKIDFERTPDGSQRITDANLKITKAFAFPLYDADDNPDLGDNPNEAGYARYAPISGALEIYNGSSWNAIQPLPSAGLITQYLRGDSTWQTLNTSAVPEDTNLYYTSARFNTDFAAKSTSNLTEGTNLYYTAARFNTAFAAKSTTDLTEGTNLYYTAARFNTAFAGKNTDGLSEGSTNLYFTNARVQTYSDTRYLQLTAANVANGFAQLDSSALIPLSILPDSILGNVKYKGTYNGTVLSSPDSALNGQPLPTAASGNAGYYFIVSTGFTLSGTIYNVGDWIISDGAAGWTKIDNSDAVTTVFGRLGNIVANTGDYTAAQVTNAIDSTASYSNPAWITSIAWSKISSTPTTVAGYGISDVYTKTDSDTLYLTASSSNVITNKDLTSGTNTFPTLNQNTTGSAAKLTTARNIGLSGVTATSQSFDGSSAITIPISAVPASLITGTLLIVNGGTGSTTQNFVDITTNQTGLGGNKGWTGVQTVTMNALGITTTDAILLTNTQAAANNAQQISPALHFQGFGWGTTGSASQSVDCRISLLPTQGTNPSSQIVFEFARNGGAYSTQGNITSTGIITFGSFRGSLSSISTTSTDGLALNNTTAATAGTPVQYSTRINQSGTVWNTTATAASNQFNFAQEARGVSATTPTASLFWMSSLVTTTTPSFTDRMKLDNSGNLSLLTGSFTLSTAGSKINISTGSNASIGTATLVAGTVTVSTTAVTANSKIFLTDATTGALTNIGTPTVGTIIAGTSFVINSSNVLDASNVNWLIIN